MADLLSEGSDVLTGGVEFRQLGERSGLEVTTLGFGTVGLGGNVRALDENEAADTIAAAWDAGIRHFDTAPWYGLGLAEHRLGHGLYRRDKDEYVVSTKVGRILRPGARGDQPTGWSWHSTLPFHVVYDYSYDGVIRSFEDSLQRMGLDSVDMLYVHDLDLPHHSPGRLSAHLDQLHTGGFRALEDLRAGGHIRAVAISINKGEDIAPMIENFDVDALMVAAPYTLLHQECLPDLDECARRGIGVVIGAVFQSGLLASGLQPGATYNYRGGVPAAIAERVTGIQQACEEYGITLPAAALQFPLGHPAVASVVAGAIAPDQVQANIGHMNTRIPAEFWEALRSRGLIAADAPVPAAS